MKINKFKLFLGFVFLLCLNIVNAANITISSPGLYNLTSSLIDIPEDVGINITVDDVILECNNNLIDGVFKEYGIYSTGQNTVIRNCNISNWKVGINLSASGGEIKNNYIYHLRNFDSENVFGISLHGNQDIIYNNTINDLMSNSSFSIINEVFGIRFDAEITNSNISSNTLTNLIGANLNYGGDVYGIKINSLSSSNIISNNISNIYGGNASGTSDGGGITLFEVNTINHNIFSNNQFGSTHDLAGYGSGVQKSGGECIALKFFGAYNNSFIDNTIISGKGGRGGGALAASGIGGTSFGIIFLSNANNITFKNNEIVSNLGGVGGNTSCQLTTSTGNGGNSNAIYFGSDSTNITFSNNNITSKSGGDGGDCTYAGHMAISNLGDGGDSYGIYFFDDLYNSSFVNNTITSEYGGNGGYYYFGTFNYAGNAGNTITLFFRETSISNIFNDNNITSGYGGTHTGGNSEFSNSTPIYSNIAKNNTFNNNIFKSGVGTRTGYLLAGAYLSKSFNNTFTDNIISSGNASGPSYGFYSDYLIDNIFHRNIITSANAYRYIQGSSTYSTWIKNSSSNIFINNTFSAGDGGDGRDSASGRHGGSSFGARFRYSDYNTFYNNSFSSNDGGDGGNPSREPGGNGGDSYGFVCVGCSFNIFVNNNFTSDGDGGKGDGGFNYLSDGVAGNTAAFYMTTNSINNSFLYNNFISNGDGGWQNCNALNPPDEDGGLSSTIQLKTNASYNLFQNNTITNNGDGGIVISAACSKEGSSVNFYIESSYYNEILNNTLYENGEGGSNEAGVPDGESVNIFLSSAENNSFIDNEFNDVLQTTDSYNYTYIEDGDYYNNWNNTVLGNSYLMSNYLGFSQTCFDEDEDDVCDDALIFSSNNTDYLPRAWNNRFTIEDVYTNVTDNLSNFYVDLAGNFSVVTQPTSIGNCTITGGTNISFFPNTTIENTDYCLVQSVIGDFVTNAYIRITTDNNTPTLIVYSLTQGATYEDVAPVSILGNDTNLDRCYYRLYRQNNNTFIQESTISCSGTTNLDLNNTDYSISIFVEDLVNKTNTTQINFTIESGDGAGGGGGQDEREERISEASGPSSGEIREGIGVEIEEFYIKPTVEDIYITPGSAMLVEFSIFNTYITDLSFVVLIDDESTGSEFVYYTPDAKEIRQIEIVVTKATGFLGGNKFVRYYIDIPEETPYGNYRGEIYVNTLDKTQVYTVNIEVGRSVILEFFNRKLFSIGTTTVTYGGALVSLILIVSGLYILIRYWTKSKKAKWLKGLRS